MRLCLGTLSKRWTVNTFTILFPLLSDTKVHVAPDGDRGRLASTSLTWLHGRRCPLGNLGRLSLQARGTR